MALLIWKADDKAASECVHVRRIRSVRWSAWAPSQYPKPRHPKTKKPPAVRDRAEGMQSWLPALAEGARGGWVRHGAGNRFCCLLDRFTPRRLLTQRISPPNTPYFINLFAHISLRRINAPGGLRQFPRDTLLTPCCHQLTPHPLAGGREGSIL